MVLVMCCATAVNAQSVGDILKATGVRGGLVVHLGCGDGRLTAALHADDSYLVHGLGKDAADVEKQYVGAQDAGTRDAGTQDAGTQGGAAADDVGIFSVLCLILNNMATQAMMSAAVLDAERAP